MKPLSHTVGILESAGFEVRDVESLREHYVRTALAWADTVEKRWNELLALVGEQQARVWRRYLAGGALSFEENRMGVNQILAARTGRADAAAPLRYVVDS